MSLQKLLAKEYSHNHIIAGASGKNIGNFNQRANSSVRSNYSSTRSQKSTATDVLRRLRDEYNDFTNGINLSAYQKKMITPSDIFKE